MIRILVGDALAQLKTLADESVHCVVTSPPYWGLRDYGTATWEGGDLACDHVEMAIGMSDKNTLGPTGYLPPSNAANVGRVVRYRDTCGKCGARRIDAQLGLEATPEEHVARMVEVFREVRRCLRADGTLWLNYGSSYASSSTRPSLPLHETSDPACGKGGIAPEGSLAAGHACPRCGGGRRDGSRIRRGRKENTSRENEPQQPQPEPRDRGTERLDSSRGEPDCASSGAPASTSPSLSESVLGASSLEGESSVSPDGPEPLLLGEQQSFRKESCTGDTSQTGGSLAFHSLGTVLSCKACGYSTIANPTYKPKDLIPMPWLVALALQQDGWYLRCDIVWSKCNPMPESVTDRPTKAHEYVFLLSKSARYFYDADAVRESEARQWTGERNGQRWTSGIAEGKVLGRATDPNCGLVDSGSSDGRRNLRSVWTIATAPFPEAHFATFPPALVEPCIKAGTSERGCCATCGSPWERVVEKVRNGASLANPQKLDDLARNGVVTGGTSGRRLGPDVYDETKTTGWRATCAHGGEPVPCTVLDPFFGAGTVGLVADRLGRNAIGIELNPKYAAMAERRIRDDCPMFAQVTK